MQIIEPYVKEVVFHIPEGFEGKSLLKWLEHVGRTPYLSHDRTKEGSAERFIKMIDSKGHHTIFEHLYATVTYIGDRGFTHELKTHRLCSSIQQSTRYCDFSKKKFDTGISFVVQDQIDKGSDAYIYWVEHMKNCEMVYKRLRKQGVKAENARSVLPIALSSEIVITANMREWRHIFALRCDSAAHPIIRALMKKTLIKFDEKIDLLFDSLMQRYVQ